MHIFGIGVSRYISIYLNTVMFGMYYRASLGEKVRLLPCDIIGSNLGSNMCRVDYVSILPKIH